MNTNTTQRLQLIKLNKLLLLKKVLFGLNMFVWHTGIVSTAIGVYYFYEDDFTEIIEEIEDSQIDFDWVDIYVSADLMFYIGFLVLFVGLLGAIAIIKENAVMLFAYSFWTFCVCVLYLVVSTRSFVRLDYLRGLVSDLMREFFRQAAVERLTGARNAVKIIDEIQVNLECCGNVGPQDYAGQIPYSCSNYVESCNDALYDFYYRDSMVTAITSLVFGTSHLIAIALAVYLALELRKAKRMVYLARSNKKLVFI